MRYLLQAPAVKNDFEKEVEIKISGWVCRPKVNDRVLRSVRHGYDGPIGYPKVSVKKEGKSK